jgi:histone deacetylase complex regulatory component SIN3
MNTLQETAKLTRVRKLEKLLRYHRQNIFHENDFVADCHFRALGRLKASQTFKDMCRYNEDAARQRRSTYMLSLWA